ncbi:MAG: hypothetical protein H0X37_13315 [Herpetosiphonaceae bacterium]|nr:hypothetical protein [Herpetosiphonaceae bacterium]
MAKSLIIERENLPLVVQGWLKAIGLAEAELVELVFTERELLLRKPSDPEVRVWAQGQSDQYDKQFKDLLGL